MTDPTRLVLTAILDTADAMETRGLRSPGEKLLHRTLMEITDRAITALEREEISETTPSSETLEKLAEQNPPPPSWCEEAADETN